MNGLFVASPMMKAKEVRQMCKESRKNLVFLLALELEIKQRLFEMNQSKAVS